MSTPYAVHGELPTLDRPVLVVMLSGWIDASGAGSAAMATIEEHCATNPLVTFDSDVFIDYRARRPIMEIRDGVNTRLVWSDIQMKTGTDEQGHPIVTLSGPEPDSQWKAFAAAVKEIAIRLGVYQMAAIGAYPFATPHSRPSRLSCTTPSAEVAANVPYLKNSGDVPAGVSAVLEHALTEAGIPSLGMWVQVPHYVSAMSYPSASVSLLEGLRDTTGLVVPLGSLEREAAIQKARIDQLVAGNEEHQAMVRQLETAYDTVVEQTLSLGSTDIPSGDELAAEFERFLRDQGD